MTSREYQGSGRKLMEPDHHHRETSTLVQHALASAPSTTEAQPAKEETAGPSPGTSRHDVPGWYSAPDFWIPEGPEYSDADIFIRPDKRQTTSPCNRKSSGTHYQLEPKFKMSIVSFQGALNNIARAAIVQQIAAAKSKV